MTDFQILKRLYEDYTKKYVKKILISVIFTITLAGSTSSIAYLLDPAIKQLFIEQKKNLILIIPALIVLAFAVKGASLYIAKVIMIGVSVDVTRDIQRDIFSSVLNADTKLIENKHSGKFISNLSNDVGMITALVSTGILNLFKDTLTLIGLLCVMFYQNWILSLFAIIMIPVASVAAKSLGKRIGKVSTLQMKRAGILNSYLMEILKNHKLAKVFQNEKYEIERADKLLENVKEDSKKINIIYVRASPIMEVLTGIMIAVLIYLSAILISKNELEVSNFFSFLAAMMLAYQPVRSLATLNISFQQGIAGAKSVIPIIDYIPEVRDKKDSKKLIIDKAQIDFQKVNFNYTSNDSTVLNSINLNIPGQKMTALVGHSGAGKSTVMNLIPRFYQQQMGEIFIDNQNIRKVSLKSLRNKISLVSQDIILFDDTVENNIKYAKFDASENEIRNACKLAAADDFIMDLPEKYKTIIGENGVRLSGGQKQRLSIARAILKNSPIILLDEATSSLDTDSEEKVQNAIFNLTKNKTTLVIAHRLSTIKKADSIIVMKDGNIVGVGKHNDLLVKSKDYENLYSKQVI